MEIKLKKRVLFVDRDGVIVKEDQIDTYEKIIYIPHLFEALRTIRRETDFVFVMVSNQDGVDTPSFPLADFKGPHERIIETLRGEDIVFDDINIDYSLPEDNCPGRKPGIAMLSEYFTEEYDLENSFMVGDRLTDMVLAKNIGCKGLLLSDLDVPEELKDTVVLETTSWLEIAEYLTYSAIKAHRVAEVNRKTKETEIAFRLDIDGTGCGELTTGVGFFDHMLEQLVKHAHLDIADCKIEGDLNVDEHHTVEDLALALGDAFRRALSDKRGINRYGSEILMMDDVVAYVAIDFSSRADIIWDVNFKREEVGGFPTEMFYHFFKSFSNAAGANIYIKVTDGNTHHQAEAIFKAFAHAVKMAAKRVPGSNALPSTKGVL